MADTRAEASGANETSTSNIPTPVGNESSETAGPLADDTSLSSSKDSLAVKSLNEPNAGLEIRADDLPPPQTAQDGIFPGAGELHQTMNQINQGINEIAASVRSLCSNLPTAPTSGPSTGPPALPWIRAPPRVGPPPYPPPPARPRSASSTSSAMSSWTYMRPPKILEAKIRRCNWENFINRFSEEPVTEAIEVLTTGPDFSQEVDQEKKKRSNKAPKQEAEEAEQEAPSARKTWIQQVRIQSPAISLLLKMLVDKEEFDWDGDVKTFKRPFRCFIHLQPKVKAELRKIEEYLLRHPIEPTQVPSSAELEPLGKTSETTAAEDERSRAIVPTKSPNRSRSPSPEPEELTTEYIAKLPGALEQIRCYEEFVDKEILPFYLEFDNIDPKKPTKVRYEDLWYIFRVGELLYVPRQKADVEKAGKVDKQETQDKTDDHRAQPSAWEDHDVATRQTLWRIHAVHIPGDQEESMVSRLVALFCHRIDYDGTEFGAVTKYFTLKPYDDERNVTSLAVYPLRFAPNSAQILDHAKAMGKKLLASIHDRHGLYSGWTLLHDPQGQPMTNSQGAFTRTPEHINSEIIVDFNEGLNQCPWWKPPITSGDDVAHIRMRFGREVDDDKHLVWSDANRTKQVHTFLQDMVLSDGMHDYEYEQYRKEHKYMRIKTEDDPRRPEPEGDDLALLPRRVIGYALWERKFVQLDVQFLDHMAVTSRDNAFDKLEIDPLHKRLIQGYVGWHFRSRDIEKGGKGLGTQDIIRGKGKGLVILLHGVPGVGKTATAEAVAQRWGKPLFPITCGDLGLTPESVERSLSRIFRLAHLWDCVLLLDEADVFISRRTHGSDLQRNALVSVFLRMLEYYNGILFLTTNLPGYLDEAVKSRVHLNLRYDALSLEQVKRIFRLNINQLKEIDRERSEASGTTAMDIFEDDIMQFGEDHWKNNTEDVGRWNGRQIRNAFSIAASLAHFDAEAKVGRAVQLRKSHFEEVEKATVLYDKYRYSILTASDSFRAKQSEARNDDFDEHTFTPRGREAARGSNAHYSGAGVRYPPSRAYEQRSGSPLPPPMAQPQLVSRGGPESSGFPQTQQSLGVYNTPPQSKQHNLYPLGHASPRQPESRVGGYPPPTPQELYPTQQAGQQMQQQFAQPQASPSYRDDGLRNVPAQPGYGQAQPAFHGSGQYGNMPAQG